MKDKCRTTNGYPALILTRTLVPEPGHAPQIVAHITTPERQSLVYYNQAGGHWNNIHDLDLVDYDTASVAQKLQVEISTLKYNLVSDLWRNDFKTQAVEVMVKLYPNLHPADVRYYLEGLFGV
jgi:hypothetical protein